MTTSDTVRVRFAPSPTGFLHIGGVRTALFNWLFARRHGGTFLLRIEDTDVERSEPKFVQDIMDSMKWLGLNWDEEPLFQSRRTGIYREKVDGLLSRGEAYRCTCTPEQLEEMRELAMKEGRKPMYDRRCREKNLNPPEGTPYVVRVKIPYDNGEAVEFDDMIRGRVRVENKEIDDFVIFRSNGMPTYNLVVVVDDVASRITHIARGEDHINNTPKQIHLYRYFNYPIPVFAHLPMILGPDKKKLSKRHGSVSANVYRGEGYLPEALLNFLVRLGWSHGDEEIFSISDMKEKFDFDHISKSAAVFNPEKLLWLNSHYIRTSTAQRLAGVVLTDYSDLFPNDQARARAQSPLGLSLVDLIKEKVKTMRDLADWLEPLCREGQVAVDPSGLKWNKVPDLKAPIQQATRAALQYWDERVGAVGSSAEPRMDGNLWGTGPTLKDTGVDSHGIMEYFKGLSTEHGVKLGDLMETLRLTVAGRMVSVGVFDLLERLPWAWVRPRFEQVLSF